jgi:hypothetical protein
LATGPLSGARGASSLPRPLPERLLFAGGSASSWPALRFRAELAFYRSREGCLYGWAGWESRIRTRFIIEARRQEADETKPVWRAGGLRKSIGHRHAAEAFWVKPHRIKELRATCVARARKTARGRAWAQGVAGSNPVAPTTFRIRRSHTGHNRIVRLSGFKCDLQELPSAASLPPRGVTAVANARAISRVTGHRRCVCSGHEDHVRGPDGPETNWTHVRLLPRCNPGPFVGAVAVSLNRDF